MPLFFVTAGGLLAIALSVGAARVWLLFERKKGATPSAPTRDSDGDAGEDEVPFISMAQSRKLLEQNVLKGLVVDRFVAKGAFSCVRRGMLKRTCDDESDRDCAVKIQRLPTSHAERQKLLRELQVLKLLCQHGETKDGLAGYYGAAVVESDGLDRVHACVTEEEAEAEAEEEAEACEEAHKGTLVVVMPFYERGELRSILLRSQEMEVGAAAGLSWPMRTRIARDVASGLVSLHKAGVLHRDLKPQNILITSDWRAKICDFNLAIWDHDTEAKRSHTAGTKEFMAPETLLGEAYSFPADMFSFGVVIFVVVTGHVPEQNGAGFLDRHPRDLFALNMERVGANRPRQVPDGLWSLATDCCDFEEDVRPDAAYAVEWLDAIIMGGYASVGGVGSYENKEEIRGDQVRAPASTPVERRKSKTHWTLSFLRKRSSGGKSKSVAARSAG